MSPRPLTEFEAETGLEFSCKDLLREAFVHSSYANEVSPSEETPTHNERLEFLGDAVLEFVVSRYLFARFPDLREGELTRPARSPGAAGFPGAPCQGQGHGPVPNPGEG